MIYITVTIKHIAELAGVSRGTVDRALNNRGGVNPEVEKRIKEIAEKLEYKPNMMAKALANSRKSLTIGVLINSGGNHFFDKVLAGIHRARHETEEFRINVIVRELTGYDVEEQLKSIDELINQQINGLVITPINDKQIIDKLNEVSLQNIHIVTLNADITNVNKLAFVGCNYFKSGQTAAELMGQISNGTAKVSIITGSNKMLGHTKRVEGFQSVLKLRYPNIEVFEICEAFDNDKTAYEQTTLLLEKHPNLTALYFCAGGIDGGIQSVVEHNLQGKIKIISVDDTDNIKSYIKDDIINLTVCQQPFKQGYDAIKIIFDKLMDDKNPQKKHMYTQNEVKTKYNLD